MNTTNSEKMEEDFEKWFKPFTCLHPKGDELNNLYLRLQIGWKFGYQAAVASQMTWEEELQRTIENQKKIITAVAEKSQNSVNISVTHIQENERLKELLRKARAEIFKLDKTADSRDLLWEIDEQF